MFVSNEEVDVVYVCFVVNNKLLFDQFNMIMKQFGVIVDYFKFFIVILMSWLCVVQVCFGDSNKMIVGDIGVCIVKSGVNCLKVNEYIFKQIIFVVLEFKKNIVGKCKVEVEVLCKKFLGCDQVLVFVVIMYDVFVKDFGCFLELEFFDNWKELIKKVFMGGIMVVQVILCGVEFIVICLKCEVSDDVVVVVVFCEEDFKKFGKQNEVDLNVKKFLEEFCVKVNVVMK